MSTIDDLAATVRAQLDEIDENARRGYLYAPEIPGYTGWDNRTVAGLPPAVSMLVQRDVAAKRALLDGLLAEKHHVTEVGLKWYCCASEAGDPCDCGRDERVAGYLALLAQPYTEET